MQCKSQVVTHYLPLSWHNLSDSQGRRAELKRLKVMIFHSEQREIKRARERCLIWSFRSELKEEGDDLVK